MTLLRFAPRLCSGSLMCSQLSLKTVSWSRGALVGLLLGWGLFEKAGPWGWPWGWPGWYCNSVPGSTLFSFWILNPEVCNFLTPGLSTVLCLHVSRHVDCNFQNPRAQINLSFFKLWLLGILSQWRKKWLRQIQTLLELFDVCCCETQWCPKQPSPGFNSKNLDESGRNVMACREISLWLSNFPQVLNVLS